MSTNSLQPWQSQAESSSSVEALRREVRAAWSTPPRLSVPAWADDFRFLAKEAGSNGGKWDTSTVEVARGAMLAVTEPGVHTITAMVCTQLMKTALIENIFGYFAHTDPCPILLLQPKEDAAEQFSKERITPMVRATPVLRELVGTAKSRNADETLLYKAFPGGFLALAGAGSADNVARRPVRVILADEIDKYKFTREGNTIILAEERTATFGLNWLSVRACSPTIEEESLIAESYFGKDKDPGSDQRRASVACPHCSHRQFLDFFKHVDWAKRRNDKGEVVEHLTKTACIHCEACGAEWSEGHRLKALSTIRWHQTKPFECCGHRHVPLADYDAAWRDDDTQDAVGAVWRWWEDTAEGRFAVYRAVCSKCGADGVDNVHAGFQASKLYSPWQKDKPSDIAGKWIAAKGDPDKELAWWNTQMGLPHRPQGGKVLGVEALLSRREVWPAEVHSSVVLITTGIDIQDYRVEIETVGWGADEESWSIDYTVIEGEFSDPATQAKVDEHLQRIWKKEDGRGLESMAVCIDSGGHHTQAVYGFSKARLGRRVWAIKGASEQSGQRSPVWPTKRPSKRSKASFRPVIIGGNSARDIIRQRLLIDPSPIGAAVPGYMHFPADRDVGYFQQLTADRIELREIGGRKFRVWVTPPGRANEASDCRVYAYAALCGLVHFGLHLNRRAQAMLIQPDEETQQLVAAAGPSVVIAAPEAVAAPAVVKKVSLASRLA